MKVKNSAACAPKARANTFQISLDSEPFTSTDGSNEYRAQLTDYLKKTFNGRKPKSVTVNLQRYFDSYNVFDVYLATARTHQDIVIAMEDFRYTCEISAVKLNLRTAQIDERVEHETPREYSDITVTFRAEKSPLVRINAMNALKKVFHITFTREHYLEDTPQYRETYEINRSVFLNEVFVDCLEIPLRCDPVAARSDDDMNISDYLYNCSLREYKVEQGRATFRLYTLKPHYLDDIRDLLSKYQLGVNIWSSRSRNHKIYMEVF